MHCWQCEEPARAACCFCGRFVCKDHAVKYPSFMAMYLGGHDTPKGIVVSNAIWCNICEPIQEPMPMPELY